MEESRKAGVKKFVQIGTVCAYPFQPPHIPFREDDLWAGYPERTNAPYGIAKKMMMVMGQAYRQEYDFNVIYLLPVNLYGPRDHFFEPEKSHVIPALIRKFVDARDSGAPEVVVWGSGYLQGHPRLARVPLRGRRRGGDRAGRRAVRRARPGEHRRGARGADQRPDRHGVRDDRLPGEGRPRPPEPDGQPRRCLDTSRAKEKFGFVARTPFEEGLRRTIAWYEQAAARRGNDSARKG